MPLSSLTSHPTNEFYEIPPLSFNVQYLMLHTCPEKQHLLHTLIFEASWNHDIFPSIATIVTDTPPVKLGTISPNHSTHPHLTTTLTGTIILPPPFLRMLEMMAPTVSIQDAAMVADAPPNEPDPSPSKIPLTMLNGHTDWCCLLYTLVLEGSGDDGTIWYPSQ